MSCSEIYPRVDVRRTTVNPTDCEIKKSMRRIEIEPLDYGFIVSVGCQRFAISDGIELISKLSKYIKNPSETESAWLKNKEI